MTDYHYIETRAQDAEEHAAGLSAWEQRYEQISPGRFEGLLEDLRLGGVQVFREQASRAVLQSGRPRPDSFTVALTSAAAGTSWFCGYRLEQDRTIAISSSGDFDFVTAPGMELLAVCIDVAALAEHARRVHGPGFELVLPQACLLDGLAQTQDELKSLVDAAIRLAREQPALLAQPALRRTLSLSMADVVLHCIAPEHQRTRLPVSAAARQRIVRAARQYMASHADEVITVPDLCEATAASRRALQYAFEDVLHLSPVAYLRMMRLNRVRHDLLAEPRAGVGDVAARWGFWHLSRFAADYRAMFGELPSATAARRRVPATADGASASAAPGPSPALVVTTPASAPPPPTARP